MRLLLDSCVWPLATKQLRNSGHDATCVEDYGQDPGDEAVLAISLRENRVLVTLDKDFGELVFAMGKQHQAIIRLVNIRAKFQGDAILRILAKYPKELQAGAIIVAESDKLRIRLP
jgi:predicted nuclease of predicted toxin-antitoxin system